MFERLLQNRLAMTVVILASALTVGYLVMAYSSTHPDVGVRVVTVTDQLDHAWSLAFLPGGDMLVTEKYTGHLRLIHDGQLRPEPITNMPQVYPYAQGGLFEVAVHPKYSENHLIYISYSKPEPNGSTTALGQADFVDDRLTDYKDIFVTNASGQSNGLWLLTARISRSGTRPPGLALAP